MILSTSGRRCKSAQQPHSTGPSSTDYPAPLTLREHLVCRQAAQHGESHHPSGGTENYAQVPSVSTAHNPPGRMPSLRNRVSDKCHAASWSKGETVRDIFELFPSPKSPALSLWTSRPSSAVLLRRGSIPKLRAN